MHKSTKKYMYRFNFSPQYGGTSEELREISFSALKKKVNCRKFQKCTQLKLAPVPGSARNLRKSYRGIFEKTPYMLVWGY